MRDPDRSRRTILDAAEALFAERGFDATTLGDIAVRAGVSRATPSYFFGDKERLYVAALEQVFAEREAVARDAFAPLVAWMDDDGDGASLRAAFASAARTYLHFLLARPAFLRLLQREDLDGGTRLRLVTRDRSVMYEPFERLRAVAGARKLREFAVGDAVLLFISLTFSPLTQRSTFLVTLDRDLADAAVLGRHVELIADQLMHLVGGTSRQ